ncbi:acylphosphatase [Arthrobacter cavernae]|uniref:acylphosphatase n=1 Tax=Arthrobacter cavernae TaxID=2817681 RepID=A0A939H9D9_9MICC|nr:acylphosphatase [Arthrobacter cavernae]MBO1266649.1 acylphosphatase [Arthrobacter cavernae]
MADFQDPQPGEFVRLTARVRGMVQGVGFRYWTARRADELALTGTVRNVDDGSVALVVEGPKPAVEELLDWLTSGRAPGRVAQVEHAMEAATGEFEDFQIVSARRW